jgi:hypothetical protein
MSLARYSSILRALNSSTWHRLQSHIQSVAPLHNTTFLQQPLLESGSHPCPTTGNWQLLWLWFIEYVPKLPSYQAQLILDWVMTYSVSVQGKLFSMETLKLIIPTSNQGLYTTEPCRTALHCTVVDMLHLATSPRLTVSRSCVSPCQGHQLNHRFVSIGQKSSGIEATGALKVMSTCLQWLRVLF